MSSLALSQLLLAVTLPLLELEPTFVPTAQSELSPSGGKSGQQLNQYSGEGESVLVSSYVHLEFSSTAWPQELSKNFTLPTALAVLPPKTLTGLGLTTECRANHSGTSLCTCHPGYQWNATLCSLYPHCWGRRSERDSCMCRSFHGPVTGYCQLLPPVPANLTLDSQLQMHGNTLNLILLKKEEATNLRWFLRHSKNHTPISLWPGTNVLQTFSEGQAGLRVARMSRHWAGEYESIFEAQGFRWRLRQLVKVPLQEEEVVRLPDALSISCAASTGFQLSCCIPLTTDYTATWSPGEDSQASLQKMSDSQCFVLAVPHCPATNTTYTCTLQSQNLPPLVAPVSITIIQDGDTTCPEDFSVVSWNVTKAGFVAQAPCPVNKKGVVKRLCGTDGIWRPVQNTCTEAKILTLCLKAKLLLEGQGKPYEEVPWILSELQEQVGVASTPSDLWEMLHTVTLLAKVVAETSTELTGSALKDLLTTTDKILDANISALWTLAQAQEPSMGSDFLKAVETLVHSLRPQQHPFSFSSANVLLQSQLLRHSSPPGYQMSFSTWPLLQARIPWHSLAPLVHSGTNVSITSLVLQKLDYRLPSNYTQGLWNTPYTTPGLILVVSITADGQAFTQAEVIMDYEDMNGTLHCVFWDHRVFQGQGGWSDEGCEVHAANASITQCICQHLTAFSILMSQHTVPENPTLDLLSQVGTGASVLALLVCLAIYGLVWRVVVRNKVAFFRHTTLFNMVICLLVADTCFLGSPFLPSGYHSLICLVTAFLCHFFYLATFFWMLAQALVLAHQLLFVFHQLSKHVVLSLMVMLGYLCPLGFAGVTLGLYLPQRKYLWEGKCFLNGGGVMLYSFSEPVLAIVGVNGLVLVIAVLKLLRPSLSEGPTVEKRQALVGVLKALLILTPIFGLTWGLGVATLFDGSIVSHYAFSILNSLQGVFILVFGCLTDKKVLEALRKRLRGSRSSNSAISMVTNETYTSEHSKERSEPASYEERMTD